MFVLVLCHVPVLFFFWGGGGCSVRVLSFQSSLFMVLWQSPNTPFLSCFLVLSRLRALFHVGVWCSDPGTLVLFQALFWFRVGVLRLALQVWSCCGSMWSRVRLGCARLCPCTFIVFIFLSLVLSCSAFVLFKLSCLSCFVRTRGLLVSLLAACSCPVLHMASDWMLPLTCPAFSVCFPLRGSFCSLILF